MTVSVVLPARDEAATIGAILERIVADQVIVVDASSDGTARKGLGGHSDLVERPPMTTV